jgi:hypothetical protein
MRYDPEAQGLTRRQFITTAAGVGIGLVGAWPAARILSAAEDAAEPFSFGLVADIHYADIEPSSGRFYRDSLEKLKVAVETFNQQQLAFAVELGDFIDAGPTKDDAMKYLHAIRDVFAGLRCPRHHVLGNHCVDQLTKEEFLPNCGATVQQSYYSFDSGRYHFVVLDANFSKDEKSHFPGDGCDSMDAWVPKAQRDWLAEDLKKAQKKTVIFVHQPLDMDNTAYRIKNGPEVRAILKEAGNVLAVFQGHQHSGGYSKMDGIHYCTLRAMVVGQTPKDPTFAVVTLDGENRLALKGYGRQPDVVFKEDGGEAPPEPAGQAQRTLERG